MIQKLNLKQRVLAGCMASVALLTPLLASGQSAQAQEARTIYLYDGGLGSDPSVKVGAWGNGSSEAVRGFDYPNLSALRVKTRNFYEGVRFTFATPVPLDQYRASGLLRVRLRSERLTTIFGGGPGALTPNPEADPSSTSNNPYGSDPRNPTSAPPSYNPGAFGGYNPFPTPTGPAVPGRPTQGGNPQGGNPQGGNPFAAATPGATPAVQERPITQLQVMVRLENGALFGQMNYTEDAVRPDIWGWQTFRVPFGSLRATPGASGGIRSVVLTGNTEGTLFLGQLAMVPNRNLRSFSIRRATDAPGTQHTEITVPPGPVQLVVDAETGDVDTMLEWNFDADNTGSLPAPTPPVVMVNGLPTMSSGSPDGSSSGAGPGSRGGRPPGVTMPPGVNLPPGVTMPPGVNLPPGVTIPPRVNLPPGFSRSPGSGNPPSGAPIVGVPVAGPRVDARGVAVSSEFPNEEQNYRVEVTARDRSSAQEIGRASIIVKVRSAE